ncbi:MAG: zinc-ribbon domain-containing protein [Candidatus Helarchaeota archaeon]
MPRNRKYDIIICDQCGAQSEPDMRFCTNCGASLTKNPINTNPTQTNSVISTQTHSTNKPTPPKQAGTLLFQRLSSKNASQPLDATSKNVTKKVKNPQNVASVVKTSQIKKPTPRSPRVIKKTVVDEKLKLKLLEHLKELNKLDRTLEASAIVRYRDHTVLAAATSSRTSENLMVTITSTIFDICQDSIKALGGGKIRILNITADNITLLLSPVNDETVLIVVTNPKSNVGLIAMYMELACDKVNALL